VQRVAAMCCNVLQCFAVVQRVAAWRRILISRSQSAPSNQLETSKNSVVHSPRLFGFVSFVRLCNANPTIERDCKDFSASSWACQQYIYLCFECACNEGGRRLQMRAPFLWRKRTKIQSSTSTHRHQNKHINTRTYTHTHTGTLTHTFEPVSPKSIGRM